jgi:hypothetical protein
MNDPSPFDESLQSFATAIIQKREALARKALREGCPQCGHAVHPETLVFLDVPSTAAPWRDDVHDRTMLRLEKKVLLACVECYRGFLAP